MQSSCVPGSPKANDSELQKQTLFFKIQHVHMRTNSVKTNVLISCTMQSCKLMSKYYI